MEAKAAIQNALDSSLHQIKMCFEGLADLDVKPIPVSMSPRETLAHLFECYTAFITHAGGGKHEWGVFQVPAEVKADPAKYVWSLREEAVAVFNAGNEETVVPLALDFLVLHDCYHVGQMCTLRLTLDPEWPAYSIYKHD